MSAQIITTVHIDGLIVARKRVLYYVQYLRHIRRIIKEYCWEIHSSCHKRSIYPKGHLEDGVSLNAIIKTQSIYFFPDFLCSSNLGLSSYLPYFAFIWKRLIGDKLRRFRFRFFRLLIADCFSPSRKCHNFVCSKYDQKYKFVKNAYSRDR